MASEYLIDTNIAQVLRDLMRVYVARGRDRALAVEARRQSRLIASGVADPGGDEAAVMAWLDEVSDSTGWKT